MTWVCGWDRGLGLGLATKLGLRLGRVLVSRKEQATDVLWGSWSGSGMGSRLEHETVMVLAIRKGVVTASASVKTLVCPSVRRSVREWAHPLGHRSGRRSESMMGKVLDRKWVSDLGPRLGASTGMGLDRTSGTLRGPVWELM